MAASVLCPECEPAGLQGFFGFCSPEPTHHYGERRGHTMPGLLGGWVCPCPCTNVSDPPVNGSDDESQDPRIGPER